MNFKNVQLFIMQYRNPKYLTELSLIYIFSSQFGSIYRTKKEKFLQFLLITVKKEGQVKNINDFVFYLEVREKESSCIIIKC